MIVFGDPQACEAVEAVVFSIQVGFDYPQYFLASSVLSASSSGIQSSTVIHSDNIIVSNAAILQ